MLTEHVSEYIRDPLRFVLYAFPWGEGALADFSGPEPWQREELAAIGEALRSGETRATAIQRAISSGHGIGKSAFVSWLLLWAMSTMVDTRGVVTANTEAQLKGKTWADLAKWHRLCRCGSWFDCTATALISRTAGHDKTWRIDMVPWSERNTEAFAGLHNKGRRVLLVFDEASAIPDQIWDVSEGALTDADTEILWIVCGNPTRNTGRFHACFHRQRHRWSTLQVDSRNVSITNKAQIKKWIDDYGEDSDFVRIRVRGVFPRAGSNQLISSALVEAARSRRITEQTVAHAPKVWGLDVARSKDGDQSALAKRQGLHCAPLKAWRLDDLMVLADIVAQEAAREKPDYIFIDKTGIGSGVLDRLGPNGLRIPGVTGIDFGGRSTNPELYRNKRAEMWSLMRDWLDNGGVLPPDDQELADDLTSPEYGFSGDKGQVFLESKDDMKKRGLPSPDKADALALTFAMPTFSTNNSLPRTARCVSNKY